MGSDQMDGEMSQLDPSNSTCPECRRLAQNRLDHFMTTRRRRVIPFIETACACMMCLKIFRHLEQVHPEVVTLIELRDPTIFMYRRTHGPLLEQLEQLELDNRKGNRYDSVQSN